MPDLSLLQQPLIAIAARSRTMLFQTLLALGVRATAWGLGLGRSPNKMGRSW